MLLLPQLLALLKVLDASEVHTVHFFMLPNGLEDGSHIIH